MKKKAQKAKRKEKKLTQVQVKKRVHLFLDNLEWAFDYSNFERRIVFEKEDKDNCVAEVISNLEYRHITFKIYPDFFTHTILQQRLFLLHELSHTYTDRLYQLALSLLNGKHETAENFRRANEEATSRITDVLNYLLRGKMRYARKAYARYLDPKKK